MIYLSFLRCVVSLFCFYVLLVSLDVFADPSSSLPLENTPPDIKLPPGYGYLLANVNAQGVSPSISFVRKYHSTTSPKKIRLKDKGFYLIPIKAGDYQVTKVDVPFFDFPYSLNLTKNSRWRFKVEKGKVNYIGKITVEKERKKEAVYVKRENKIAEDFFGITEEFRSHLSMYPLVSRAGHKDDFLRVYFSDAPVSFDAN